MPKKNLPVNSVKNLLLRVKYPPLWLLLLLIFSSLFVFWLPQAKSILPILASNEYLSVFVAGLLFGIGLLTPFCAAFFVNFSVQNIFVCGIIGGFGALIMDLIILNLIKKLFKDEVLGHKESQLIKLNGFFSDNWVGRKIVNYASFVLAPWIVAAPLPNDMGKKLVLILLKLNMVELAVISFCANTIAITFFLWL